ncbi:MAG: NAD(P)/FAD-dependent oxidoreductase, partial [Candidatus Thorarchaeota archaeon]
MKYDLIVVGGGPAGSTCARWAAKNGLHVLVLDKEQHPRRKVCAGGFRASLPDILDFDIRSVIEREACGSHLYAPSGLKVVCTKNEATGYTVRRSNFDHHLLEKAAEAGAEVRAPYEVVDVEEHTDYVSVLCADGTTFSSRCLVGADGVNSRVARSTGLKTAWSNSEVGLCLEARVPMDSSDIERITLGPYEGSRRICIEIFFGGLKHGYAWCFPKREEVSLGMGCLVSYARDLKRAWERFVRSFEERNGIRVDLSETSAMRVPLAGPINTAASRLVMLAGDAGGFVSPATGEGIYYAIETGRIAGQVAVELVRGNIQDVHEYDRRSRLLRKELSISNFLANLMFNSEDNMETVVRMAATDSVMRGYMTELIGGLKPY